MRTVVATLAVAMALIAVSLPASAGYTSPNSSQLQQAFQNGVP